MTAEDIEDEIERTRGEMADTLGAIERRLSPKQLMEQVVDAMRDLANDQSRAAQIVRENPWPLALIGVGLGWLAVAGARQSSARPASTRVGSYESMEGVAPAWGAQAEQEGAISGFAPGVEAPAYGYGPSSGGLRNKAEQAGEQASSRLNEWRGQARTSVSQAAGRTRDAFNDHPLTMGVLAALAGVALGALLPRSRIEEEGLGQAGGELVRHARQAGSDLAEKAGRVAERAAGAAKAEGERALRQESGPTGSGSSMTH